MNLQVVPDHVHHERVVRPMQFTDLEAVAALEARSFTLPWSLAIFHGDSRARPASAWSARTTAASSPISSRTCSSTSGI